MSYNSRYPSKDFFNKLHLLFYFILEDDDTEDRYDGSIEEDELKETLYFGELLDGKFEIVL